MRPGFREMGYLNSKVGKIRVRTPKMVQEGNCSAYFGGPGTLKISGSHLSTMYGTSG